MDKALIITHAITGSLALLSGMIALIVKKGSRPHVWSGRIFFYTMLISALLAIIISQLEGHENQFLMCMGVLTVYFLVLGLSAIRIKTQHSLKIVLISAGTAIIIAGIMLISISINGNKINVVSLIFGAFSVILGITDFRYAFKHLRTRKTHISLHLSKITGAYIASVTAFVVVNQIIPGILGWILPGILGGIYIGVQTSRFKQS